MRLYIQPLRADSSGLQDDPVLLPGTLLTCPPVSDAEHFIYSTRKPWPLHADTAPMEYSFISTISARPLRTVAPLNDTVGDGWILRCGSLIPPVVPDRAPAALLLHTRETETGNRFAFAELRSYGSVPHDDPTRWLLPGMPVGAAYVAGLGKVAILCEGVSGDPPFLYVRDVTGPQEPPAYYPISDAVQRKRPIAIQAAPNGDRVYVLVSGYQEGTSHEAWCHVYDPQTWAFAAEAVPVAGSATPADPSLLALAGGICWINTYSPVAGFGHLTRIRLDGLTALKEVEQSFSGVGMPLSLAVHSGGSVAVGAGKRLEIWRSGFPQSSASMSFEGHVRALAWESESLLVGEGNRVHRIDPETRAIGSTATFQQGVVTRLLPFSTGKVPEMSLPASRAVVPPVMAFRGEAAGREMRALRIAASNGGSVAWDAQFDREAMPWLRAFPLRGSTPGLCYLGIDPTLYGPGDSVSGVLKVNVADPISGPLGESPARVIVDVVPARQGPRRIFWILGGTDDDSLRGPNDPYRLKALVDRLSGPPFHFSHHLIRGTVMEPLDKAAVVVINAAAAARGMVTRAAVLDYVSRGGALLFLNAQLNEEGVRDITHWIGPSGVYLENAVSADGIFPSHGEHPLSRMWQNFHVTGAGLRADGHVRALAGDERATVLAVAHYDAGRIAAMAGATPIESDAMAHLANQRFASALFSWLAKAGGEVSDLDGDGLSDAVEDQNGNGLVDSGETDKLNPDTDGDGIADGVEDRNRNGVVDEGETSPINADSDADGTLDGADEAPLPPVGAPHVASLEPQSWPAEGGVQVLIEGRNFAPDSQVWFGDLRATTVRPMGATALLAEAPPYPRKEGGTTDVRVVNPATDLNGVLPEAFRYVELSKVRMWLDQAGAAQTQYTGTASVYLAADPEVAIGSVAFDIATEPRRLLRFGQARQGAAAEYISQMHMGQEDSPRAVFVEATIKENRPEQSELLSIAWTSDTPLDRLGPVPLLIVDARVMSPNGQPLDVTTEGFTLQPPAPPFPGD
ncbi:MAG: hypothetical protein AMXMBFR84_10270 [Candidatus Hydrogenedentota bacterium]